MEKGDLCRSGSSLKVSANPHEIDGWLGRPLEKHNVAAPIALRTSLHLIYYKQTSQEWVLALIFQSFGYSKVCAQQEISQTSWEAAKARSEPIQTWAVIEGRGEWRHYLDNPCSGTTAQTYVARQIFTYGLNKVSVSKLCSKYCITLSCFLELVSEKERSCGWYLCGLFSGDKQEENEASTVLPGFVPHSWNRKLWSCYRWNPRCEYFKSTLKLQLSWVGVESDRCFTALLVSHEFSSTYSCKWDCSDNWFSPVIHSIASLILLKLGQYGHNSNVFFKED